MSKVYVTQDVLVRRNDGEWERKFDLSKAAAFGDIVTLLESNQSLVSVVPVVRSLMEQLRGFSDDDYLLPIGHPAIMVAAGMIAGERNRGRIKILSWDRRRGEYLPIQLDTSGKTV